MVENDKKCFICFIHIEKCSGTSFHEILSANYPYYWHLTRNQYGGNDQRNELKRRELNVYLKLFPQIQGIGGHRTRIYNQYEKLKENIFYITFLRDPIKRYLSHLNHRLEADSSYSFEDLLSHDFYKNYQTVRIGGGEDLELAIKNLGKFSFIGDTEQFKSSLINLKERLPGFKLFYVKENVRQHKKSYLQWTDLSEEQKKKVIHNNQLDIELYDYFNNNLKPTYLSSVDLEFDELPDTFSKDLARKNKERKRRIERHVSRFFDPYYIKI